MKKLYRHFASTELTIILAALIVLDAAWGSFVVVKNPLVSQALDQAILLPWLFSIGKAHLSVSLWIFILVFLVALFAVNTFVCTADKLYSILKDKRPWQSLLPHIVHIGFLIALLGHLLGSTSGFKKSNNVIFQGQAIPVPTVQGLAVRFDNLEMKTTSFMDVEDLKTSVTLIQDGTEILKHTIRINGPLIYMGIAFYHADHGEAPTGIILKIGKNDYKVRFGGSFTTEDKRLIQLGNIYPDFALDAQGNPITRSFEYNNPYQEIISQAGKRIWLPLLKPGSSVTFEGKRIDLVNFVTSPYVVLTINKDPGIGFIIAGSALLVIGMILLLFLRGERAELVRQKSE